MLPSCGLRITAELLLWILFLGGQGVNALQSAGRQGTGKDSAVVVAEAQRPQEGKLKVGDLASDSRRIALPHPVGGDQAGRRIRGGAGRRCGRIVATASNRSRTSRGRSTAMNRSAGYR